jgi:hypothetical protein
MIFAFRENEKNRFRFNPRAYSSVKNIIDRKKWAAL